MRHILMLALFFTCLSAAAEAADPLTKRSNDASLRKTQHVQPTPPAPFVKPNSRGSAPTR
jgi:hypothetical protein